MIEVYVKDTNLHPAIEWCLSNLPDTWECRYPNSNYRWSTAKDWRDWKNTGSKEIIVSPRTFRFTNKTNATIFKLMWGGNE